MTNIGRWDIFLEGGFHYHPKELIAELLAPLAQELRAHWRKS